MLDASPLGTIVTVNNQAAIHLERHLPYPIESVWAALTDPAELAVWFGPVQIEPRAGGSIIVESGPDHIPVSMRRSVGKILVWDPPHVLEFEWRQAIIEASTLRYELTADGDGTRLKLVHQWLSVSNARGFIPGWHAYLDRLSGFLGNTEMPDWVLHSAVLQKDYPWA